MVAVWKTSGTPLFCWMTVDALRHDHVGIAPTSPEQAGEGLVALSSAR